MQQIPGARALAVTFAFCLLPFAFCARNARAGEAPPPDPEIERQSFKVAEGFEVQLFAADPLIAKPIQMNFGPDGRLWVVSSSIYPQIKPGEIANDKVVVLEDKDGDGKAESGSVFVDGLLIPTGLAPGDGGVYVANSTELLHFKDTDGDGKADFQRTVLSGFGTEDTHHILHTLRWGPEGLLYFNQSIYIHSHIETPHGPRRLGGGGIWRFRPANQELEVFVRGMCNPWGTTFDRWGQFFGTDGASDGEGGIHYLIPGAQYKHFPGGGRFLASLHVPAKGTPGTPKYCGAELVSGRHLPDDWQGNILTNDFRANRVVRFQIKEEGSGYSSTLMPDVIRSTDRAFRPIDVKMGPDGAIYIADWYNPIIQHGEVDFRSPLRDKTHGRIWRLTAKGRPLVERPKLVGASTEQLLEHLKAPEDWTRQQAKRVLAERPAKDVLPAAAKWVAALNPADAKAEHLRLEALWVFHAADDFSSAEKLLESVLNAKDGRVRAAAVRVLQLWHKKIPVFVEPFAARVADDHPRVRLEAIRALKELGTPRALEIALRALDKPTDRFLEYALWLTCNDLKSVWLPAFEAGQLAFGGNPLHLEFALKSVNSPLAAKTLLNQLASGKLSSENVDKAIDTLGGLGGSGELGSLLDMALVGRASVPVGADPDGHGGPSYQRQQARILAALARAAKERKVVPAGDLARIKPLLGGESEPVRAEALRLAGALRIQSLRAEIVAIASDEKAPAGLRGAAFEALAALGAGKEKENAEFLAKAAKEAQPTRVAALALAAWASLDARAAAEHAVHLLGGEIGGFDQEALFNAFLRRAGGAEALAEALGGRRINQRAAEIGIQALQGAGQHDSPLKAALEKAGALGAERKEMTKEEMTRFLADVAKSGSAERGKAIFSRKELTCIQCHAVSGTGGQVGPDLTSLGASAPPDYIVDSLYFPGKAVKENFHAVTVATNDGRVFSGVKLRENPREIALRDAQGQEISIPADSIRKKKDAGSIMPSGLLDKLKQEEVLDLVKYLLELKGPKG